MNSFVVCNQFHNPSLQSSCTLGNGDASLICSIRGSSSIVGRSGPECARGLGSVGVSARLLVCARPSPGGGLRQRAVLIGRIFLRTCGQQLLMYSMEFLVSLVLISVSGYGCIQCVSYFRPCHVAMFHTFRWLCVFGFVTIILLLRCVFNVYSGNLWFSIS